MPDTPPKPEKSNESIPVPVAALLWLAAAIIVFILGTLTISLQDEERFPNNISVEAVESEDTPQQVTLNVLSGTFEYNVRAEEIRDLETGTFDEVGESPVARLVLEAVPEATSVEVTQQDIIISHEPSADQEAVLRTLRNPISGFLDNERATITAEPSADVENAVVFSTSDPTLRYAQFIPQLIPSGESETYATREEGLQGSPLAQFIFTEVTSLEALTIEPDRLIATYREGAALRNATESTEDALNDFYPRASLRPDLWLLTVTLDSARVLSINPFDTGILLFIVTIGFAVIEGVLTFVYRSRDEKLLRPLVRVVTVFFFFWSIFGHEPLWDYLLSFIFPTSRQLVHPNATVIEFAAQHMELVIVSSLITVPSGLLFGILVTREQFRELLPLVNNIVNSGQTVPTIAIVAFMAPIIGFGFWPAIIALIAYGLLPVVRNTIAGIEAVDGFIIDSARGMGLTPTQILFQVELPVASRVIMAGIRTSMVVNVGTATLGAFVGSGGLGTPIASGLSMTVDAFILLGAIPAAILAILIDYILDRIEYVVTPRGLQIDG